MAISRGAGTEIIRTTTFEDVNDTVCPLIIGEQHHIYTVLSIVLYANSVNTDGSDYATIYLVGYDSYAGTTAQEIQVGRWLGMNDFNTFVFNDKFSFTGFEPTDFAGPMDDATKQNAMADQGSSVAQKLYVKTNHSSTVIDGVCTYIDQNNA